MEKLSGFKTFCETFNVGNIMLITYILPNTDDVKFTGSPSGTVGDFTVMDGSSRVDGNFIEDNVITLKDYLMMCKERLAAWRPDLSRDIIFSDIAYTYDAYGLPEKTEAKLNQYRGNIQIPKLRELCADYKLWGLYIPPDGSISINPQFVIPLGVDVSNEQAVIEHFKPGSTISPEYQALKDRFSKPRRQKT